MVGFAIVITEANARSADFTDRPIAFSDTRFPRLAIVVGRAFVGVFAVIAFGVLHATISEAAIRIRLARIVFDAFVVVAVEFANEAIFAFGIGFAFIQGFASPEAAEENVAIHARAAIAIGLTPVGLGVQDAFLPMIHRLADFPRLAIGIIGAFIGIDALGRVGRIVAGIAEIAIGV